MSTNETIDFIEKREQALLSPQEPHTSKEDEPLAKPHVLVGNPITKGHQNFTLMYDMLTGIRISVSRNNAKPLQELTNLDFSASHKLAFDGEGNEMTPTSEYDFKFKDYAPSVFRSIRETLDIDDKDYLNSLTGQYVLSELGSPGKSGSFFYFSRDYRFIIKTIHHSEHKFLLKILNEYHKHIKENHDTLLSRIYGLHRVKLPGNKKIHFVIMGNVFPPNKDIHRVYDLKGSTVGRSAVEEADNPTVVLKDLNWKMNDERILLGDIKKKLFQDQLNADVELMRKLKIMDYSLLIGMHDMEKGNRDNIRTSTLAEFSVNNETLTRQRRKSTQKRLSIKRTFTPPTLDQSLDPIQLLPPNLSTDAPKERVNTIFYADDGGFQATDEDNRALPVLYFIGVIDIFTRYSAKKKVENFLKGLIDDKGQISAVNPKLYAKRFLNFVSDSLFSLDKRSSFIRGLGGETRVSLATSNSVDYNGFVGAADVEQIVGGEFVVQDAFEKEGGEKEVAVTVFGQEDDGKVPISVIEVNSFVIPILSVNV